MGVIFVFECMLIDWQKVIELHGDDRPLGKDERRCIDANRHILMELMNLKSVIIDRLYANKCFSQQHQEFVESGTSMAKKVNNLFDIVRCRSVGDFKRLTDTLYRDGQLQLARLLVRGGGMCSVYIISSQLLTVVSIRLTYVQYFMPPPGACVCLSVCL